MSDGDYYFYCYKNLHHIMIQNYFTSGELGHLLLLIEARILFKEDLINNPFSITIIDINCYFNSL